MTHHFSVFYSFVSCCISKSFRHFEAERRVCFIFSSVQMDETEKMFNRKGVQKIHHSYQVTTKNIVVRNILICSKRKLIPQLLALISSQLLQWNEKEISSLIKNQKIQVDHIKSLCYTTKWMCILYNGKDFISFFSPFSIFFAPFLVP